MPDARVQAAVDNWGARLIANGVQWGDWVRTTASISQWEEWLEKWCATAQQHVSLAERALKDGHRRSAGEAFLRAAVSFHFAKFVWVLDPARNREVTRAAVGALYRAHSLLDLRARRIEAAIDGGGVAANLRLPTGAAGPHPLVILIPGLDSTKEEFFIWESVFLGRGMATLSLDGPGQGETGFSLPIRFDYEVAVAAMLDAIAGRGERIAQEAPRGQWVLYEDGTHVCNNIPFKYRPLVADWIRDRLG